MADVCQIILFISISAIVDEDKLRYERLKKKTYIRVMTSLGPLNLELHSDMVTVAVMQHAHILPGYYIFQCCFKFVARRCTCICECSHSPAARKFLGWTVNISLPW